MLRRRSLGRRIIIIIISDELFSLAFCTTIKNKPKVKKKRRKSNLTFVQYAEKMYWVCLPFPCFDQSSRTEEVEGSECDEEESKGSE